MTPVFPARRRAEEFAHLVERSAPVPADARYAEFLEIVAALQATPAPQPRPAFVVSLRERLMAAAETALVPASPADRLVLPARRPRDRRIAAAVGGLAIVGATTSMAVAAQSALPGDVLYPLKRAIENVHTGIAVDEGERGTTLLASAEGRLDEIAALSREGRIDDPEVVADTLDTFTAQAIAASDYLLSDYADSGQTESIDRLQEFTAQSMETLVALEAVIPAEARDELVRAAMALSAIEAEARQACPDCAGPVITELPAILQASAPVTTRSIEGATIGVTGSRGGGEQARGGKQAPGAADGAAGGGALPETVLQPPSSGDGGETTAGGDETASTDEPVGALTSGLAGGDGQPASNQPGIPGLGGGAGNGDDGEKGLDTLVEGVTGELTGQDSQQE